MGKQTKARKKVKASPRTPSTPRTPHQISANDWVFRNRGRVAEIGRRLGVSGSFVYMVLMGKRGSRGERVEKALRRVGAPILEDNP